MDRCPILYALTYHDASGPRAGLINDMTFFGHLNLGTFPELMVSKMKVVEP